MDEKKKFEISDDMLENVSGGTEVGDTNYEDWKVGDKVIFKNPHICPDCGKFSDTGTIVKITNWGRLNITIDVDCCGGNMGGESYLRFKRI